jgi:hypothetical protein
MSLSGGQSRVRAANQARTPSGSVLISMVAGSRVSIRHPSVNASGIQAEASGHQRVFTGAAADVEHPAADRARFGPGEKRRLGPPMYQGGGLA